MLILGIETSCDETAASIVFEGREVVSNIVHSQIKIHEKWGGVIPELASRAHIEYISPILNKSISDARAYFTELKGTNPSRFEEISQGKFSPEDFSIKDIDAISVSNRPGLIGSLLVGVNAAKALAWIHDKPLIPVNHLFGHICANYIDSDLEPPFLCLLASGGHTQIIAAPNYSEMDIMGETIDDAAGEAFDKVARLFNLPYPGGPELDKLAKTATDTKKYSFTIAKVKNYDFSFSGLKTAVLRLKEKLELEVWEADKANIAYAFQDCIAKTFVKKLKQAIEATGTKTLVIAGGVAANSRIRELFAKEFSDCNFVFPQFKYCTDNAAMIASAAYFQSKFGKVESSDSLDFEVMSRV